MTDTILSEIKNALMHAENLALANPDSILHYQLRDSLEKLYKQVQKWEKTSLLGFAEDELTMPGREE